MDDLNSADNQGTAGADNQSGPASTEAGTGGNGGQATGATPTNDLFKGMDPNKMPPDVRAHYDSMLRDYREKTGKLSETIKAEIAKATESYRQKAEFYDQFSGQDEFVKQWNDYVQKVNQASAANPGNPELDTLKTQLQEVSQKIELAEMSKITDAFAEAVDEKGAKMHPEFDQLNSFMIGQLGDGNAKEDFSLLRGCIELAPGNSPSEKLANGYKAAKAMYDSIFEAGRKAGMGRLAQKAQNGSLPPSHSTGGELQVTEKKPKSAREALEMAKRGMMVSRD
jgi:hypothetical protein